MVRRKIKVDPAIKITVAVIAAILLFLGLLAFAVVAFTDGGPAPSKPQHNWF